MGSMFGEVFRIGTWGESHGTGVGAVIDGCPARIPLSQEDIQRELDRRRPGQSDIVTPRREEDKAEILSGVLGGLTLGTPIAVSVRNKDYRSEAYDGMRHVYRPSHADFCYDAKYGIRAWAGGGRASARETVGRVAAGAVARAVMKALSPATDVLAYVSRVHRIEAEADPAEAVSRETVESSAVRTNDPAAAEKMLAAIREARAAGDSLGGIITCVVRGCPAGLGDPVFDKLEATLAHAMMSIPACRGFEVGSGFAAAGMRGSEHNDAYCIRGGRVHTVTNRSGGIQGGISNGEPIVLRLAFKPTATLMIEQRTVNDRGEETLLKGTGRHDPCVLPRAVPVVEAMAWITLCDHFLRQKTVRCAADTH
ncbi:MAG: chorismate synthase [Akkermansiaceae bacterium]|nr:chorismate synthase [Akkermansia sp.]MCD7798922.1 chorismate synthase [Akkermansiaceae bacterium]MCD8071362.1 chorismate synthase [Akkermansiaceae bacterium]